MKRRTFLRTAAAATSALGFPAILRAANPNSRVTLAVAGMGGRGTAHAVGFAGLADVSVAYVCDVDEKRAAEAAAAVGRRGVAAPKTARDFRDLLDDKSIDAIAIATPNHWHAPAAILACAAGKHVYCEKPCSQNPREGEWLVHATRKHGRIVQHGTQRRSWPGVVEGIARLHEGAIGRVVSARGLYFNARPSIGKGKAAPPPAGLDWPMWQGPAPEREFRENFIHYNWHWFWHWGNGELGNNGVHMLDVCRWGLRAGLPLRIESGGAKLRFPDDDQETPDVQTATFDYGDRVITWDARSWAARTPEDVKGDVIFHGEGGSLVIDGGGYRIYDLKGVETAKGSGPAGDREHFQNFIDAIRGTAKLTAEIEEGAHSALLCHLGNIALRTGRTLRFDPEKKQITGEPAPAGMWQREYRDGWEAKLRACI